MRRSLIMGVCVAALFGSAMLALAGPVRPFAPETGYANLHVEPFSVRTFTETCKAGERTAVIAVGRGNTSVAVYVYDQHGNCVAWDDYAVSRDNISDDVALEFHPPQEMKYEIELRNLGRMTNRVEFAIR
jgi:hypothetical protein